jgi:tetratricopeptide (TPR) repeat protein
VTTAAMIVLGILTGVLFLLFRGLFSARVGRLKRTGTSAVEVSRAPPVGEPVPTPAVTVAAKPVLTSSVEAMAAFPAKPTRFVGRAEVMAAARTALAPGSGRTAVVFHGIAGAGKTTCAVELAYHHQRAFRGLAFWSAPTDPDQFGEALRLLAVALEAQLGRDRLAMVQETATLERTGNFLPTLTAVFADAGLLLVLDNLDILLTPEGQWRDRRWVGLISALTDHQGSSRVILTSRIVPAGLDATTVLIRPVPLLSRDESLRLVGELPHLRAALRSVALARRVLTLAQGHPMLLELAEAAAADPHRLAYQLAELEAAVDGPAVDGPGMDGAARTAFLTQGYTRLDAEQVRQTVTTWTITVAAAVPAPARLLLQVLCRIEETDRNTAVLSANWPALWRRLDQPGAPPPLAHSVDALVTAALITTESIVGLAEGSGPVRYRIHPGVAEAIHAATPESVTAAVDAQLAAWWTVVGSWEIDQRHTSHSTVRTSLAAARYLLRQHDWNAASCLLERALIRAGYSPAVSAAVLPLLRRIAEATGARKDLVVLGAALRKVDPGAAETLLRHAYQQAAAVGDDGLASTTAGDLITLLRDAGRLREALTLADQKIEHTRRAGFGSWTRLSDHGRRLQILTLLGHHEQVLREVSGLRAQTAALPDQRAPNDRVSPWHTREGVLDVGRTSAVALQRWDDALELNGEIAHTQRRRGASPQEIASTRFHDYLPLRQLGRLTEAEHLLRECQHTFDTAGDLTQLALVYAARAEVADTREHPVEAVELQRAALRLRYLRPDPSEISQAHHQLATYLSRAAGDPAEQRAHRLSAALLHHLTGDIREFARTLEVLASELRADTSGPETPALPTTLSEVTRLVDAGDGVRFGDLVLTLCPDPTTAEHALIGLVTTATRSADRARRS